ncbi:hypothetical protein [Rodentibacter trehalosifermentans]|uniref:hypothetical protein n=1 Tax=Rodentibacter trehalosifermentans TaxID=1908263 RepID=UPI001A961F2D|nr:hypothetical protein [Rodentibacter trehalosifermentans]
MNKFIPKEIRGNSKYASSFKRLYFFGGLRFDLKIIAVILSPFFLLGLITVFINTHLMIYSLLSYIALMSLLSSGILIGNFYYKTYNNHYDLFIFGLVEDDTKAIVKNIYDD